MDIQTKHRVTLLNAKCEYVCAVDTLVKKINYGEDVDCCINKLFLASRLINRLDCYCFDSIPLGSEKVMSQLSLTHANDKYNDPIISQLIVDGVQVYSHSDTINTFEDDIIETLLNAVNYEYIKTQVGLNYIFNVTAPPNVRTIVIQIYDLSGIITKRTFTLDTIGVPSVSECYNCISDSDLPKMYEVLNSLLL